MDEFAVIYYNKKLDIINVNKLIDYDEELYNLDQNKRFKMMDDSNNVQKVQIIKKGGK